jgi:hypothetical protein
MLIRKVIDAIMLGSIIGILFFTGTTRPVLALSIDDYFTYTYSFVFNKTEISGSETFFVTVSGQANCIKDLPVSVSAANITSRIVARHIQTGTEVVLNANYLIRYDSGFPTQKGQSASASVQAPLSFPDSSPAGVYEITGQILEAKISVLVITIDIAGYLPSTQKMGSVNYSSPAPSSFMLSDLTITPVEVTSDNTVTITVLVSNTGDLSGTFEVVLKLDGQTANSQSIELAGKSSKLVTFTHLASIEGRHFVTIGNLSKEFTVNAPKLVVKSFKWWLVGGLAGLGLGLGIGCGIFFATRRKKL